MQKQMFGVVAGYGESRIIQNILILAGSLKQKDENDHYRCPYLAFDLERGPHYQQNY